MTQREFEEIVKLAMADYANANDLPITVETLQEKGFSEDESGLIVTVGGDEFHLAINQTVFEDE